MADNKSKEATARWLVLLAGILWGTTGTAKSFAPEIASPATVGAVRLLVGGIGLLLLALKMGSLTEIRRLSIRTTILAAAGLATFQPFFFSGVEKTGVAVGTVVTIGSSPIISGILALVTRGERPQVRWFVATALSVVGCVVLFIDNSQVSVNAYGIIFSLCAGFGYALYSVASKQLIDNHDPVVVAAAVTCTAALLLSPVLFTGNLRWLAEPRGWIVALHLGLITSTVCYFLFSRALVVLPVSTAVTLSLAEPLTAALLGILVLGEKLSLPIFVGAGLVMTGLAVLFLNWSPTV
ncbi:MAG: DMT family transporter [Eubacteriales bacterium]